MGVTAQACPTANAPSRSRANTARTGSPVAVSSPSPVRNTGRRTKQAQQIRARDQHTQHEAGGHDQLTGGARRLRHGRGLYHPHPRQPGALLSLAKMPVGQHPARVMQTLVGICPTTLQGGQIGLVRVQPRQGSR